MIKKPCIVKMLDVSTGHMTKQDNELLSERQNNGRTYSGYELAEYGWLLYCTGDLDESWPIADWSPALRKIMAWAKKLGCDYVRFDRDGTEYEDLEHFDW
jgi:hypothetical protein